MFDALSASRNAKPWSCRCIYDDDSDEDDTGYSSIFLEYGSHLVTTMSPSGGGVGGQKLQNIFFLVNIDSPNLGSPYFNFLEGYQWRKKHPV